MKKKKKKFLFACLFAAAPLLLMVGCERSGKASLSGSAEDSVNSGEEISAAGNARELFKIEGKVCQLAQAKVYVVNYQNIYGRLYGVNLMEQEDKAADFEQFVKNMAVTQLAQTYSMVGLAEERGITLTESQQAQAAQAAQEYYASLNAQEVEYFGATEESIQEMYENYALANVLYDSLTEAVDREVSDDEARVMQAQQIVVSKKETAKAVKKALAAGEEFSVLAADYNEAEATDVTISRGEMPEEVETEAFSLENGEYTDSIETSDGYYFIYCVNKFDEELTAERKEVIAKERQEAAFDSVYDEYVRRVSSKLNESVWEMLAVNPNEALTTDSFFTTFEEFWEG